MIPESWLIAGKVATNGRARSNLSIKIPPSTFRYLRVSISRRGIDHGNLVLPQHVHGAVALNTFRAAALFNDAGGRVRRKEQPHETVLYLDMVKGPPVDRMHFDVPQDRVNFRRLVTVATRSDDAPEDSEDSWQTVADGDISRVRATEGNPAEDLDITTHDTRASHWRVIVRNGDDPPLPMKLTAQSVERRLYFNPQNATTLKLFYGDSRVGAPVYEYDKLFRDPDAATAVAATLGPEMQNVQAAPRPDERPWTERHKWVLWSALIVAVLGLAVIALRGLKKA